MKRKSESVLESGSQDNMSPDDRIERVGTKAAVAGSANGAAGDGLIPLSEPAGQDWLQRLPDGKSH